MTPTETTSSNDPTDVAAESVNHVSGPNPFGDTTVRECAMEPILPIFLQQLSSRLSEDRHAEAEALVASQEGGLMATDCLGNLLHHAVFAKDHGVLEWLLHKGIDVHARDLEGLTPLMFACEEGHEDAAKTIFFHDPSQINDRCDGADSIRRGRTPLMFAAFGRNIRIAEFLLSLGADVNAQDENGLTPLLIAAQQGNVEMMRVLLSRGASLLLFDADGADALAYAVGSRDTNAVAFLLSQGADINHSDSSGYPTALRVAILNDDTDMVGYLLSKGARASWRESGGENAVDLAKRLGGPPRIKEILSEALGRESTPE
jgi:ankyrin repeat protein